MMRKFKIGIPVITPDGKELLPAGTVVTGEVIRDLIASNNRSVKTYPIFDHVSLKKDLREFLSTPPYNTIFSDKGEAEDLFTFIDDIKVIEPILQFMDYFKENDFYTYRHILVVFALTTMLSRLILPGYEKRLHDSIAGPAHDFGKICIPLEIMKKSTPLTRGEFRCVRHHTLAGYVLLSYYLKDSKNIASVVARDHHEKLDGTGYPRGIQRIHPMVEIIAVSDIYDALIADRPYRPVSYDNRSALEELTEMAEAGKASSNVVRALIARNRGNRPDHRKFHLSLAKRGKAPENNNYGIRKEDKKD